MQKKGDLSARYFVGWTVVQRNITDVFLCIIRRQVGIVLHTVMMVDGWLEQSMM